jgi:hypothetical protein
MQMEVSGRDGAAANARIRKMAGAAVTMAGRLRAGLATATTDQAREIPEQ